MVKKWGGVKKGQKMTKNGKKWSKKGQKWVFFDPPKKGVFGVFLKKLGTYL